MSGLTCEGLSFAGFAEGFDGLVSGADGLDAGVDGLADGRVTVVLGCFLSFDFLF